MAEVDLDIQNLTTTGLLATADGLADALENNVHFPAPDPSPEGLRRLAAEFSAADQEYRRQRQIAEQAQSAREMKAQALRDALAQEAAYVQKASGGNIARILSANLHVEEERKIWPFGSVAEVEDLSASIGDQPGEIDLAWDPVPGASGYEVELAQDFNGEGPWEACGASNLSKITIGGLHQRARYWFRVRAVGESGVSDMSAPVMKFAP